MKHMPLHYTWRGNSYAQLGETDNALEDYAAAIRVEPKYLNAYLYRSLLYHRTGEIALSKTDFAEWMKGNASRFVSQPTPEPDNVVSLNLPSDQYFAFKLPVKKGQILTVETATPSGSNVDPILLLVESGTPQAYDDDGGVGVNAAITRFVIPGDCVYDLYLMHGGTPGTLT